MKFKLVMTCGACPEQYDVLDEYGFKRGYLRLRNGYFTARLDDPSGPVVYAALTDGDGIFTSEERQGHLDAAVKAIAAGLTGPVEWEVT